MYQKILGTAICTNFAPPYVFMFMDQVERKFLKIQKFQPLGGLGALMIFSSSGLMVKTVSKIL